MHVQQRGRISRERRSPYPESAWARVTNLACAAARGRGARGGRSRWTARSSICRARHLVSPSREPALRGNLPLRLPTIVQSPSALRGLRRHPGYALVETFETPHAPRGTSRLSVRPFHRMVPTPGSFTVAAPGSCRKRADTGGAPTRATELLERCSTHGYATCPVVTATVGAGGARRLTTFNGDGLHHLRDPAILGFAGVPALQGLGPGLPRRQAATCLVAGVMTS